MKSKPSKYLENCRVRTGFYASTDAFGMTGMFVLRPVGPSPRQYAKYVVISSDGEESGWEHASVSLKGRNETPTWEDMCFVKDLFWKPEETVIQYHPAEENYINNAEHVLHLWRPREEGIPLPPPEMVGVRGLSQSDLERVL